MKIVLVIILCIVTNTIYADDVFESIKNGDWSDDATWNLGSVPGNNDEAVIHHNVNLDVTVTTKTSITIEFGASLASNVNSLEVKSGATLIVAGELQVYNLQFDNGSIVQVQSTGIVNIENNFKNKNNSDNVVVDGLFNVAGDFDNGNGGVIIGSGEICTTGTYSGAGTTFGKIPSGDIAAGSCIRMSVMPIELISFTAEVENENIYIRWTTASEKNNEYFEIKRSDNGVDFEVITTISGAGNSSSPIDYSYIDMSVPKKTIYYQLKQVDYNGDFEVFDLISVNNEEQNDNCTLNINPNPCIGKCNIAFNDCNEDEMEDAQFMIYDATGHVVYTSLNKPIEQGKASFSFDVNNGLKPAIYIVRGTTESNVIDKKAILQKSE